ncbi:MAG TPA: NAD(P)H-dependent oxidoreductase [Salinisphaeraceae bacterium]|nr:NAD(P)H-dependent oxidoreductase [Salinisphaeraceae bacterium]
MKDNQQLLIVAHAPSPNTRRMVDAVLRGARHPDVEAVSVHWIPPLEATADDVLACDAIILGTSENLGYMSGALKDFFDRIYYPCLEQTEGLPYVLYVRAGMDGTGTKRAVAAIASGLRWQAVQEPLTCRGEWQDSFADDCEELGTYMAAGLDARIF